jgi:hypothetical protein
MDFDSAHAIGVLAGGGGAQGAPAACALGERLLLAGAAGGGGASGTNSVNGGRVQPDHGAGGEPNSSDGDDEGRRLQRAVVAGDAATLAG